MGQLKLEGQAGNGGFIVKLIGSIDEDSQFSTVALTGHKKIFLDLDQIKSINSVGIREWIKWTKSADADAQFIFQKCPKVIVDQMNLVSGFLPDNGKVESFFVPYFNEDSGFEKMVLFNEGKEFNNGQVTPPAGVKGDGGEELEMDVIEAKYFKFLQKK